MKLHNLRLSFVIVEYHSIEDIAICTSSIAITFADFFEFEIIVSSNSMYSTEQQSEITKRWDLFRWVFNEKNGGFAYAMNRGLAVANGDILIILNPDVQIKFGFVDMVNYLGKCNNIGIIAPKLIDKDGKVQDSYRNFITPISFLKRNLLRLLCGEREPIVPVSSVNVDWVIGAFMMMSRESYEAVNGLDENYFLYCEDMDLCRRMHLAGYSVVYYPEACGQYVGTRSARKSRKFAWIFLKSLFRYWNKFGNL